MWGTKYWVNLPKPKLNSSDSQVSHAGIFWDLSTGQGHFCLVQECYVANLYVYMSTKSYTFIPYRLQDHKVQCWKKKVFFHVLKGYSKVFGAKQTIFSSRYGMSLFGFLFLGELGTFPQNLMPTQGVEP
jgi:hypothetical protein